MRKTGRLTLTASLLIFAFVTRVCASEMMRSANALESGKIALAVYGIHTENDDLEFHLRGANLITVPLQGGGTAQFFAQGDTDLQFQGKADSTVLRLTWRPASGLAYTFKAGTGDYEIQVPSGSAANILESGSQGWLWGVDAAWTLVSNTPVSPAVALAVGYARSDYKMDRLRSGASPVAVNQRFSLEEWQLAVSASQRWKSFEPFGGLRIFRQVSALRDVSAAARVKGRRDGYSPFAGLRWEFMPRESLVLEVSGADETVAAAGLAIGF